MIENQIPAEAICSVCGKPMKVRYLDEDAARLGVRLKERGLFVIECCGYQLRIEDDAVAREVRDILEVYHSAAD